MVIADASPLIVLAKIGRLTLVHEVYDVVALGPWVEREVVERGRLVDARGALEVESGMRAGWIQRIELTQAESSAAEQMRQSTRLGAGEAEALAVARSRQCMVILDDKEARYTAQAMAVPYIGTAGVVLAAYAKGRLSYDALACALTDLGSVLWLAPSVVAEILRRAREIET